LQIEFEHDYQQKVMTQRFVGATVLDSTTVVQAWRSQWMKELSSWHSPYKVLVDCSELSVGAQPEVAKALDLMIKFFNGFFLRKVVGFGYRADAGLEHLPFPVLVSSDEAAVELGIRAPKERVATDFRSTIQLQNHFQQHSIELSFSEPVAISTKEQVQALRSKIMNNLMQWHSKWSLIIDCANLEVSQDVAADFERLLTVLRGFFMKQAVGYSPSGAKESYPFPVFRARHRAVAEIEGEGNFSGDDANCRSRKS
jgi:hypothetical protein